MILGAWRVCIGSSFRRGRPSVQTSFGFTPKYFISDDDKPFCRDWMNFVCQNAEFGWACI